MILLNLVEKGPVTDFEQVGRRFTIPTGLLERGGDRGPLGLASDILQQRLQAGCTRITVRGSRWRYSAVQHSRVHRLNLEQRTCVFRIRQPGFGNLVRRHQGLLDERLEFTDVPRPGVSLTCVENFLREQPKRQTVTPRHLTHEVSQKYRDFLFSLAQRQARAR